LTIPALVPSPNSQQNLGNRLAVFNGLLFLWHRYFFVSVRPLSFLTTRQILKGAFVIGRRDLRAFPLHLTGGRFSIARALLPFVGLEQVAMRRIEGNAVGGGRRPRASPQRRGDQRIRHDALWRPRFPERHALLGLCERASCLAQLLSQLFSALSREPVRSTLLCAHRTASGQAAKLLSNAAPARAGHER